jgi:hypothetical protein
MRVWFDTKPPSHTDIDIVEQGNVPILMSLPQMRNLGMTLEMTRDAVYMTCHAFNCYHQPLQTSKSNHIVLDLASVKQPPKAVHGPCPGSFYGTAALADNQKMQLAVRTGGDEADKPSSSAETDELKDKVPTEGTSSSSRDLPAKAADPMGDNPPVPDTPGPQQGPTQIPLALRRIHERLNKPTELLKLHLLHYHMPPAAFKRRTSALSLPEHVYEKYTQVCLECSACNEARPPPSHSKVSGLRATNFGDDDVNIFSVHGKHARLDFIGDVGNYLNRFT